MVRGFPSEFVAALERATSDAEQFEVGVEFAIRQVRELIDAGVPGLHFYVLNQSPAAVRVLQAVGVTAHESRCKYRGSAAQGRRYYAVLSD